MRITVLVVLFAILIVGGYLWQNRGERGMPIAVDTEQTYQSAEYGISFTYPDSYVLEERELGTGERFHHNVTLMDREAAANIPQNGEGPTTITVDFIQNNIEKLSIEDWIRNDSRSNFKLSPDGELVATTMGEKEALTYIWDGLYRGQSIVFAHKETIVMYSVTYMTSDDEIVFDSIGIFESIQFL